MGTQVLQAQDFFIHPHPPVVHRHRKSNPNPRRGTQKRMVSAINRLASSPELTAKHQIKKQRLPVIRDSPATHDHSYAGSTFLLSPSPTCLPLPSFFNKKQGSLTADHKFDDTATKDLRRLLRLD